MRTNTFITDLWAKGGPFIGDHRPHGRVTVQLPWSDLSGDHKYDILRTTYGAGTGNYADRGLPLRWYQDAADDQAELEVPNVAQIHTTRTVDQDAATFEIIIRNQQMYDNNSIPVDATELGQPGFFTATRGVSHDAQARWNQATNQWQNLLVPNAVIRTFQGYGGNSLSIEAAEAAHNIMLTGVWIVDHVEVHSDGTLKLSGRDGMKFLIDQQLYMPLVPKDHYPLTYYRWVSINNAIQAGSKTVTTTAQIAAGDKTTNYEDSSENRWYPTAGNNPNIHGHLSTDAFDGNVDTYWLSVGNSRADAEFAVNWLQATCGEAMNAVYINPWAGNYTCYVSVMENGAWQGADTIPYDPSILFATQSPAVDTGAAIPYVAKFGIPWEGPAEYVLDRVYQADRVRISFRDLTYTEFGPWHYRAGVREFKIRASGAASTSTSTTLQPLFYGATSIMVPGNPTPTGYLTVSNFGTVDAFGDARVFAQTGGASPTDGVTVSIAFTKSRQGYYVMQGWGGVQGYGDAVIYGQPTGTHTLFADIIPTHTGLGYWIISWDGVIQHFGDAPAYTNVSLLTGEILARGCRHPTAYGLFLIDSQGNVSVRGSAVKPAGGDWTPGPPLSNTFGAELATDIQCTSTGGGYWILTSAGRVQAKGTATNFGEIALIVTSTDNSKRYYEILPAPDDGGYLIMKGDGNIYPAGIVQMFGSPLPGSTGQLRKDGNYLDYVDIIRDLALWSGFLLYDPATPTNAVPPVYGNLESTGAFSPEALPTAMFDKRAVIDAMRELKEVVGYLMWVDDEGAFRFESPNWWAPGNFDELGNHTATMMQLDEKVTLISYTSTSADDVLRSLIIISSEDPDPSVVNDTGQLVTAPPNPATITARLVPKSKKQLRGLCKPAMWINGYFIHQDEQYIMAELIALHSWFQSRVGQMTCVANPCLQINDQVRVWERQSAESYIHYVRGVDTSMDLEQGSYTMNVTTNWLGDESSWSIVDAGNFVSSSDDNPNISWVISDKLVDLLHNHWGSKAGKLFGHRVQPAQTSTAPGSQTGTGSGPG